MMSLTYAQYDRSTVDIFNLKIRSPFKDLFPIEQKILTTIQENIEKHGYDQSAPIIAWNSNEGLTVIDGHTRLIATQNAGLKNIPIIAYKFKNEEEALQYSIHNQRDRRNMTDADILRCVEVIDKKKQKGGNYNPQGFNQYKNRSIPKVNNKPNKPSHIQTAEILGISGSKVQQSRIVLDNADEKTKKGIVSGQMTIHRAYIQIKEKKKQEKAASEKSLLLANYQELYKNFKIEWGSIINKLHEIYELLVNNKIPRRSWREFCMNTGIDVYAPINWFLRHHLEYTDFEKLSKDQIEFHFGKIKKSNMKLKDPDSSLFNF